MDRPSLEQSLNIKDYLRPVWTHKLFVAGLVLVATVGSYVFYDRKPDQYVGSTDIYLRSDVGVEGEITGAATPVITPRDLADQARLLRTRPVAVRVAREIGYRGDPVDLLERVTVTPDADANFVTVTATAGEAQSAAELANAFARTFIDQRDTARRRALTAARTATQRQLERIPRAQRDAPAATDLGVRLRQLQILETLPSSSAAQLEEARPPAAPVAPRPERNAAFAFALSLIVGAIAAYGLDRLDPRLRRVDDVRHLYGALVLASLAPTKELSSRRRKRPPPVGLSETFRMLRSAVDLSRADGATQVLLVTSGVPGEGKSTVARYLATSALEVGRRVALIEADLRRPSLASQLGVAPEPGLSDVLAGRVELDDALQSARVELPGLEQLAGAAANGAGPGAATLSVLTSGSRSPNPATLLAQPRLAEILARVGGGHDTILVDSAPLLPVADTLHLVPLVDGILLVSRLGYATAESAARVTELLGRYPGVPLLGIVANDVKAAEAYGYAGYAYERA